MAATDWTDPTNSTDYTYVLDYLKNRDEANAKMDYSGFTTTYPPVDTIRWNATNKRFEKHSGSGSWAELESGTWDLTADSLNGYDENDFAPIGHVGAGASAHAVATTGAHGFMSSTDKTTFDAATNVSGASTLVKRDASGNFECANPVDNLDAANKQWVDGNYVADSDVTSAGTPSTVCGRDGTGGTGFNGHVATLASPPTNANHLTRKDYVDSEISDAVDGGVVYSGHHASECTSGSIPNGWSISNEGGGVFRVTHNLGTVNYAVVMQAYTTSTLQQVAIVTSRATNYFEFMHKKISDGSAQTTNIDGWFIVHTFGSSRTLP